MRKLHWSTWAAMLLMAGVLVRCQTIATREGDSLYGGEEIFEGVKRADIHHRLSPSWVYGWPFQMLQTPGPYPTNLAYQWQIRPAVYNAVSCLILVVCTGFVVERWRRNRWQLRVASLFQLTAIVAILLGLRLDFGPMPWWLRLPILIGLACLLWAIGWAIVDYSRYVAWKVERAKTKAA